jgi:prepilin-type N-terminal cleavage/methylation domain-containing protein
MKSGSIGIRAAFSSSPGNQVEKRSGFTLLEALVALAVLLAFVSVLVPFLFHARRIMDNSERRIAAQILLRTLLSAPFDRSHLANAVRTGELNGLHWRIVAKPLAADDAPSNNSRSWTVYRIAASVSWGIGQSVAAETARLAKSE